MTTANVYLARILRLYAEDTEDAVERAEFAIALTRALSQVVSDTEEDMRMARSKSRETDVRVGSASDDDAFGGEPLVEDS